MRRRIQRVIDIWYLGRMAERAICDPDEHVVIQRGGTVNGVELFLRVDGAWTLSPASARLIRRVWARADS
jgi:hypothetical protein